MENNTEVWKQVPGYARVRVSNLGRVQNGRGRVSRGSVAGSGYYQIGIRVGVGEYQHKYVHRLVLETFVGPCPEGMEACHNDGNPRNNHVSNLRWDTRSANIQDVVKHGRNAMANKTHCPRGHALVEGNLVPSLWKRGNRSCLACSRAHAYARRRKIPMDSAEFKELAGDYFEELGIEQQALDGGN